VILGGGGSGSYERVTQIDRDRATNSSSISVKIIRQPNVRQRWEDLIGHRFDFELVVLYTLVEDNLVVV